MVVTGRPEIGWGDGGQVGTQLHGSAPLLRVKGLWSVRILECQRSLLKAGMPACHETCPLYGGS